MSTPAIQILVGEIIDGDYDDDLNSLAQAINSRRDLLLQTSNAKKFAAFKKGDVVKFYLLANSRYLSGNTTTISEVFRNEVGIKFTERVGKFMPGATVRCPVSIIDKVEKE